MSSPSVRASVVVPVRNGRRYLEELLAALTRQELAGELEIIAIDSGSTDGSLSLLERSRVRLFHVEPDAFDHGVTRNLGAEKANGAFVVFMSQDALPADPNFVRHLIDTLDADPRLAGAFARQVPRPEADALTRRDLRAWVAGGTEPRRVFLDSFPDFVSLSPAERHRLSAFDNVASAVRRDRLLEQPFEPTRFGEDLEWGQRILKAGYGLAYVPAALVVHSHERVSRRLFRRNYLGHRLLQRLFGLCTVPDRTHLLRASLGAIRSDLSTLAREGASFAVWLAAPAQAVAATYGQYRGGRDEALGRPYPEWA